MSFKEINPKEWSGSPSQIFGEEWAALSAGTKERGYNAMTIAWGNIGSLWERESHANRLPIMSVFVRRSRYTYEFMEKEEMFTVAFFGAEGKKKLGYLGSVSGRSEDKYNGAHLTPIFENDTVYPNEAELVFICRKLYAAPLESENFIDKGLVSFNYPNEDYHTMYIGEIERILSKD